MPISNPGYEDEFLPWQTFWINSSRADSCNRTVHTIFSSVDEFSLQFGYALVSLPASLPKMKIHDLLECLDHIFPVHGFPGDWLPGSIRRVFIPSNAWHCSPLDTAWGLFVEEPALASRICQCA